MQTHPLREPTHVRFFLQGEGKDRPSLVNLDDMNLAGNSCFVVITVVVVIDF